ncbi:universal stress protein [Salinirussus salinus]|jgi:nucleotide-binding universal stress UspA family protein|uniref:universal stress protein n=1 Tax=Salinirussus salinus TaxID=1198300 RepID=UPI00135C3A3A|nr:universal stress protein [Salinirussus salinus]
MVFLVPYDGSASSEAALARAVEHGAALGEEVVAVSFVPTGDTYAQRRRWIEPDEDFAVETASADLRRKIEEATDDAERQFTEPGAESPGDGVSSQVRQTAVDVDASVVFVGTGRPEDGDGAGAEDRMTTPFGSVDTDAPYDLHLVRRKRA